jgi:heptosyltransferase-3
VRIAVLSCLGLGDGLISLVLSNNLYRNGHSVVTIHPCLQSLQSWFPHLPIIPLSTVSLVDFAAYDKIFLFHEKTPRMMEIQEFCLKQHPNKIVVLNPIATLKNDYPFWENGKFDGSKTFVDNLANYCTHELKLKEVTKSNGMTLPSGVQLYKYPKRVVIHPTSSQETKNWPWEKFEILSQMLEAEGWEPYFLLTKDEKTRYPSCRSPEINNLSEMAAFVAESGAMVGNDSGVGHLASCLGLPTVTICRNKEVSYFWRPAWAEGKVIAPPTWLPNLKWMRWRDRHWKKFIPIDKVFQAFKEVTLK